jgi:DNA-binding NtrC family response regulator
MTILLADDNREFCATIGDIITSEGWKYDARHHPGEALEYLRLNAQNVALMLLDVDFNHPTMTGIEVLAESRKLYPHIPVVMISGTGTYGTAVQATKMGAENFIHKSEVGRERIKEVLYTAMERVNVNSANSEILRFMQDNGLVGTSSVMISVAENIIKYGRTELNVLVTGDTGTGKKIAARALHAASRRMKGNFVTVDIPNIPQTLFQSELFGHVKNAFTGAGDEKIGLFQQANGGTLFLDEIGDLPLELQASLLLPIDNKIVKRLGSVKEEPVNVRIVSATDRNLPEAIRDKKFRDQLYHRLRECEIALPPLRERREDIPLIVEHFTKKHNEQMGEQKLCSAAAIEYLQDLAWEGNVRQLESLLKRVLQTASRETIEVSDIVRSEPSLSSLKSAAAVASSNAPHLAEQTLLTAAGVPVGSAVSAGIPTNGMSMKEYEEELRRQKLIATLQECNGNVSKAAARLEVSRETLHTWMRKFKLESAQFKKKNV